MDNLRVLLLVIYVALSPGFHVQCVDFPLSELHTDSLGGLDIWGKLKCLKELLFLNCAAKTLIMYRWGGVWGGEETLLWVIRTVLFSGMCFPSQSAAKAGWLYSGCPNLKAIWFIFPVCCEM